MTPLGHRTYLKAKAGGENSMSEKAGCSEAADLHAGRGPDGMVKARLLEPKSPIRTTSDRKQRMNSEVLPDGPTRILSGTTCSGRTGPYKRSQGDEMGTYSRPERHLRTERRIP